MLELRPSCENCNKMLPPDSLEARICSYECARSAPRASIASLRTSARTAVGDSCPDRFDRRTTGKATTILVRIPRVPRSSIGRLIGQSMRGSLRRSKLYRLTNDRIRVTHEQAEQVGQWRALNGLTNNSKIYKCYQSYTWGSPFVCSWLL
jgi:hypothetical protein